MISFINPMMLLGLGAALLPLIIHILSRFRATEHEFSSLLLLRQVQSRNVRRLRNRQILLLILRTLIIIALVLIPARPVVKGMFSPGPQDHSPTAAVFILDKSASTGFVGEKGPAISLFKERSKRIIGWLNPADRYMLLTADDAFKDGDIKWYKPGVDDTEVINMIEEINPSFQATNLGPAIQFASQSVQSLEGNFSREVYIFSDCQRGFLGPNSILLASLQPVSYYLVGAHEREPGNISVERVGLPGELIRAGAALKVTADIAFYGTGDTTQVFPRIYLDDRLTGQGEVKLGPGEKKSVVVEIPPLEPGTYELSARIDADGFDLDNRRDFLMYIPPQIRVLLIEPGTPEKDYLGNALEVLSRGESAPISFGRRDDLPVSPAGFRDVDVFIIHGISFPEASIRAFFREVSRHESKVFIIPDAKEKYERVPLRTFNSVVEKAGLPLNIEQVNIFGQGGFDSPELPGTAAASDDLAAGVFEALPALEKVKIFAMRRLPPVEGGTAGSGQAAAGVQKVLTKGGSSFLQLLTRDNNKYLISSSDLSDPVECELPETPLFIPFLHNLIAELDDNSAVDRKNIIIGEKVKIILKEDERDREIEIHSPGGRRFFTGKKADKFENTDIVGVYKIFDGQDMVGAFYAGIDHEESDISIERENDIKRRLGENMLTIVQPGESLENYILQSRAGVEIWSGLLILALGLLIVEQIVANRKEEKK